MVPRRSPASVPPRRSRSRDVVRRARSRFPFGVTPPPERVGSTVDLPRDTRGRAMIAMPHRITRGMASLAATAALFVAVPVGLIATSRMRFGSGNPLHEVDPPWRWDLARLGDAVSQPLRDDAVVNLLIRSSMVIDLARARCDRDHDRHRSGAHDPPPGARRAAGARSRAGHSASVGGSRSACWRCSRSTRFRPQRRRSTTPGRQRPPTASARCGRRR